MKTFFDGMFIDEEKLYEEGIEHPIKLEYFKTTKEENVETKFGIEVVKTEYLKNDVKVERKRIDGLTSNMAEVENILALLKNNEVTPVGVEDVLQEILVIK